MISLQGVFFITDSIPREKKIHMYFITFSSIKDSRIEFYIHKIVVCDLGKYILLLKVVKNSLELEILLTVKALD